MPRWIVFAPLALLLAGCELVLDTSTVKLSVAGLCIDGKLDGEETDLDCGGPDCAPCARDKACRVDLDCESARCGASSTCAEASCSDGVKNGAELGVDCGGTCPNACAK